MSITDGVTVVKSTTKNAYASTALEDTGLENGKVYYYRFFPYTTGQVYTFGSCISASPQRVVIQQVPTQSGTLVYNKTSQSPTWDNYDPSEGLLQISTISGETEAMDAGTYTAVFVTTADSKWWDGTVGEKEVEWTIDKAPGSVKFWGSSIKDGIVTLNSLSSQKSINADGTGNIINVDIKDTNIATINSWEYFEDLDENEEDKNSISAVIDAVGNYGTTKLIVEIEESNNYYGGEFTLDIKCVFVELVSWATGTDQQITNMVNAYYGGDISLSDVQSVWSVGDARTMDLEAMEATGVGESHVAQTQEFVIIDFDHDGLVTQVDSITKSLITVQQLKVLSNGITMEGGYMNKSNLNAGGWTNCDRRAWINTTYKNALPIYIQNLIKHVYKHTSIGGGSTTIYGQNDLCFLLSEIEIFGEITYSVQSTTSSYTTEGSQYSYYATSSNRIKYTGNASETGSASLCWLRSPVSSNSYGFCYVDLKGVTSGGSIANGVRGLAPAFCL
jgi:hypothetical protein